ncbi:hypothetical protein M758_6G189200 [Ceratodon purpureus]|uniref:Uncharacterized protein n=1 Tax=Ceratodon purpureus TaxID=3225 RepID=A0A8T0HJE9_CERPU|nr:hypothetical protein KC19_6G197400 [Ceratodon purpureus]KAG0614598.1 hypothetical protein M758_6G189200 [Ceratodon purpureus]
MKVKWCNSCTGLKLVKFLRMLWWLCMLMSHHIIY